MVKRARFQCVQCGNCCRDKNSIITITHKDISRLVNFLKCDFKELLSKYVGFYQIEEKFEERLVFPAISTYRGNAFLGLRKKSDGSCVFLNDNLCEVYPGRPMVCRSFPFVFSVKNGWLSWGFMARAEDICPGLGKGEIVSEKSLEKFGKKILDEVEEFKKIVTYWNSQVEIEQQDPVLLVMSFFEAKFPSQST
ncbi:MAG: YkgJ family cysteine cluster protein [Candidatus Jordarchaeum sp.]|uniref:YkgJ family cysteine cluster protein n=1 Tax=Candidatus Jordarchaeum sp. TaxID=2823881 RepID=UPI004049C12A